MNVTLESLKQDERNLIAQLGHLQGAIEYNRQLQIFISKEPEPEPEPELTTNQTNVTL